jgi:hypothetical protein
MYLPPHHGDTPKGQGRPCYQASGRAAGMWPFSNGAEHSCLACQVLVRSLVLMPESLTVLQPSHSSAGQAGGMAPASGPNASSGLAGPNPTTALPSAALAALPDSGAAAAGSTGQFDALERQINEEYVRLRASQEQVTASLRASAAAAPSAQERESGPGQGPQAGPAAPVLQGGRKCCCHATLVFVLFGGAGRLSLCLWASQLPTVSHASLQSCTAFLPSSLQCVPLRTPTVWALTTVRSVARPLPTAT